MKKLINLFFFAWASFFVAQNIHFPDANFKNFLLQSSSTNGFVRDLNNNSIKLDQNNDGEIQVSEAENISLISFNGRMFIGTKFIYYFFLPDPGELPMRDIESLDGISYFKNLRVLDCAYAKIKTLDFTNLSKLEELYCKKNQITTFENFQYVKSLYALDCSYNLLENLDMSQASINSNRDVLLARFNNNNLNSLNLQNNKSTAWCCLCSWTYCPFGSEIGYIFNTCCYQPNISDNPNLTDLKVNCYDKQWYPAFATDNCDIQNTSEIANLKDKIKISQNQSNGILTIIGSIKIVKYTILDMSGRIIKTEQTEKTNIDISSLNKGNYIIKVETTKGVANLKFIKN